VRHEVGKSSASWRRRAALASIPQPDKATLGGSLPNSFGPLRTASGRALIIGVT